MKKITLTKSLPLSLSLLVLIVFTLLFPFLAHALVINEIMYDAEGADGGREWVEVFNEKDEDVIFTEWKLLENKVKHSITNVGGGEVIKKDQYAVIADNAELFLIDNPDYQGLLFESVFSLSNTGEELSLVDNNGNVVNTVSYTSSLGGKNGLSLQLLNDVFISAKSTPGLVNALEPYDDKQEESSKIDNTTNSQSESSHSEQISLSSGEMQKLITVHSGRERLATVFTPIKFEGLTRSQGNSKKVKFIWNFGDGKIGNGKNVEHVYKHPGVYNVVLNAITGSDKAVSRTKVSVFYPKVILETKEQGLLIKNKSNYEINIGGFELGFGRDEFKFPKDTIISSETDVLFDWSILDLRQPTSTTEFTIDFYYPSGKLLGTSTRPFI